MTLEEYLKRQIGDLIFALAAAAAQNDALRAENAALQPKPEAPKPPPPDEPK